LKRAIWEAFCRWTDKFAAAMQGDYYSVHGNPSAPLCQACRTGHQVDCRRCPLTIHGMRCEAPSGKPSPWQDVVVNRSGNRCRETEVMALCLLFVYYTLLTRRIDDA